MSPAPAAVVTGEQATEEDPAPAPAPKATRPVVVWVTDGPTGNEEFDKLEEVVFKTEKVALAMKAFRAVKMTSEDAEKDPLLKDEGSGVPRILVVGAEDAVKVLEKNRLTGSAVYDAMKKAAAGFYAQNLDKVVKEHLKLLTEVDKLSAEEKLLADKESKQKEEDGSKASKDLEKIEKELADVRKRLEDVAAKQRDLWNLTPKDAA